VLLNGATGTAAGTTTLASGSGSHVEAHGQRLRLPIRNRGTGDRLAGQAAVRVEDQSVISTGLGGAAPLMTIGPAGTLTGARQRRVQMYKPTEWWLLHSEEWLDH